LPERNLNNGQPSLHGDLTLRGSGTEGSNPSPSS
jgi:hypothetical protein